MTPDAEQVAEVRKLTARILRTTAFLALLEDLLALEDGDEGPVREIEAYLAREDNG